MGQHASAHAKRLGIDIALHYLTNVVERDDGVAMNHDAGRMIEVLADRVRSVTLLAYEPPPTALSSEDDTPFVIKPRPSNLRVVSLGPKGTWREYRARARRVREVVEHHSGDWDVLVLRLVNRRAHLVFEANRCPRVVTQVGGSNLSYRMGSTSSVRKLMALPLAYWEEAHQRRIIRGSGLTFVVGEDLRDLYARTSDRVHILRHSALRDTDFFVAPDRFTDPRKVNLMFAGQVIASKGPLDAVDAFARIKASSLADAHLHIVGGGTALEDTKTRVRELGLDASVTFHGWIGDRRTLLDLYRRMDVLLCLSHVDFMPRVVWEALASSVLVIATPVGALPQAFDDGEQLTFVPVGDPGRVADAVAALLSDGDRRRHLLARGLERAREATIDRMVDGLLTHLVETWPELGGPQISGKDASRSWA